jgi:hypothetical protein
MKLFICHLFIDSVSLFIYFYCDLIDKESMQLLAQGLLDIPYLVIHIRRNFLIEDSIDTVSDICWVFFLFILSTLFKFAHPDA